MLRPYMTGLVFWRLFSANPDLREGGGARRGGAVVGVELEGSGRSALAQSGRRENGPIKLTDMAFLRLRPCPGRGFTPGCVLVATSEGEKAGWENVCCLLPPGGTLRQTSPNTVFTNTVLSCWQNCVSTN